MKLSFDIAIGAGTAYFLIGFFTMIVTGREVDIVFWPVVWIISFIKAVGERMDELCE